MTFRERVEPIVKSTDLSDHRKAADEIRDKLMEVYGNSRSIVVIVYSPVKGWSKHGVSAGYYEEFFRVHGSNGEANVVVLWSDYSTKFEANDQLENMLKIKSNAEMDVSELKAALNLLEGAFDAFKDVFSGNNPIEKMGGSMESLLNALTNKTLKGFLEDWAKGYNNNRALWICKRYEGVEAAWTNTDDVIWVVGDKYTICTQKSSSHQG